MDNPLIRRRARRVFMAHFLKIGLVVFACTLLSSLPGIVALALNQPLPDWANLLWGVLIAPLSAAGLTWFIYGLWKEEAPDAGRVLRFLRSPGLAIRAIGVELVVSVIAALITSLPLLLLAMLGAGGALLLYQLVIPFALYFTFRLEAAMTAFVRYPDRGVRGAIALSWRVTRGAFGRLFCMQLAVSWPVFLVTLPLNYGLLFLTEATITPMLWLSIGTSLALTFLYSGYMNLSLIGLTSELIDDYETGEQAMALVNAPFMDPADRKAPAPDGDTTDDGGTHR